MQTKSSPNPTNPATQATGPAGAGGDRTSPEFVYVAARAVRDEFREQLETLVQARHSLLRELEDHDVPGPARTGMEQRIVQIDLRIAEVDKAIANADAQVARTASVPGAVTIQPPRDRSGPPEEVYFIGPFVLLAALLPISIAFARRLWRKSATAVQEFPRELMDRLGRLEQMGETTALEVERIGEGQRFVTRLMTERSEKALGEGESVRR